VWRIAESDSIIDSPSPETHIGKIFALSFYLRLTDFVLVICFVALEIEVFIGNVVQVFWLSLSGSIC